MMTKNEFYKWVDSFGKNPGEYTEEELIEIGIAHKENLVRSDKDWTEIAIKLFGESGKNGEAFRKWILSKRYAMGKVEKNPKVLDDKTVENVTASDVSDSLARQEESLYIAKTRYRDERNALTRSLRDEARLEELYDLIRGSASELKDLEPITYVGPTNEGGAEAILMFSDWHIGQEANNFYNTYNYDVARQRVMRVVTHAIDYCKVNKVAVLHVLNLGDLIEGIINTNARIEASVDVCDQIMKASELMAEALALLQGAAPRVTYRDVTDNHSRVIQDKHMSIAKENLCRIVTWFLKERLGKSKIEFIDDNLDIGLGRFTLDNSGLKVAFMHGHEDSKGRMLQNMCGAVHEWTDIVCMGHLHNPAEHVYQDMRLYVNGSLCGTGPYALQNRLFTKPSQKLIVVDKGNLINIDIAADDK